MEDNTIKIHVVLGGIRLPLRVSRKDEEIYRKAEKMFSAKMKHYQMKYSQQSYEYLLALTAFQFAVALSRNELAEDTTPLKQKIQALDDELKAILSEE